MSSTAPCTETAPPRSALSGHPEYLRQTIQALRQRRKDLKLSQPEVSWRIGVSDDLVAKWEIGDRKPSPQALWWWAEALGCEVCIVAVKDARRSWR